MILINPTVENFKKIVGALAPYLKLFEIVDELPTTNINTHIIYLVPSEEPEVENGKDEYINLDGTPNGWEKIGSTTPVPGGEIATDEDIEELINNLDNL